jgi:hypothetical protein
VDKGNYVTWSLCISVDVISGHTYLAVNTELSTEEESSFRGLKKDEDHRDRRGRKKYTRKGTEI